MIKRHDLCGFFYKFKSLLNILVSNRLSYFIKVFLLILFKNHGFFKARYILKFF